MKNKLFILIYVILMTLSMACTSLKTSSENSIFAGVEETEAVNIKIFEYLENKIIFNIDNGLDIEEDIDFNQIKVFMSKYKLQPDSKIIKINNKPYDSLIVQDLQKSLNVIQAFWEEDKKSKIHKAANDYFNARKNKKQTDEYILSDLITYYSYQAENSQDFFLCLMDQFQLPNVKHNLEKLPEVYLEGSPLPMSVIIMDNIPIEATAAEVIDSIMKKNIENLIQDISNDFIGISHKNYSICVSNVKSYVDWYYSISTQPKKLIKRAEGWVNNKKTGEEAVQEYVIGKYIELVGRGTSFEDLTKKWQHYNEIATVYTSAFLYMIDSSYYQYDLPSVTKRITTDDYMLPVNNLINYLQAIGVDGIQNLSMGNKLDAAGNPVIDVVNIVVAIGVGFVPYAGMPLEILVDILFIKINKKFNAVEFEKEIIAVIRNEQKRFVNIVNYYNYGGRYEN